MREPPSNVCPLMAIAGAGGICILDRCALWDFGGNECVMAAAATALREVAASLEDMRQNPKRL